MTIETEEELAGMKAIGQICGETLKLMRDSVRPGMTTKQLDEIGAEFLRSKGARSAPILTYRFPGHTCISLNDEAAHGIPSDKRVIQEGDLINIDVSAELNGFIGDTGASYTVGDIKPEHQALCNATKAALRDAIAVAQDGNNLSAIGRAVQNAAEKYGFRIIRELGGHGVGRGLHEEPRRVPNYFTNRTRGKLHKGLVLTIEPFFTYGTGHIFTGDDGWTLSTLDGTLSAQYEHTIMVTENDAVLLTDVGAF